MPTLPAPETGEEKGEIPLLARSQLTGSALDQELSIWEHSKERPTVTRRQPQRAVVGGAPQKSTELGAQQHHTSMPTDAGSPFIFTLSRGGECPLGTQGTQRNQLNLSTPAPWQGAAHPRPGLNP